MTMPSLALFCWPYVCDILRPVALNLLWRKHSSAKHIGLGTENPARLSSIICNATS